MAMCKIPPTTYKRRGIASDMQSFDLLTHAFGSKLVEVLSPSAASRAVVSSECNREPRNALWSIHTAGDAGSTSNVLVHVLAQRANTGNKFMTYNAAYQFGLR
jgi:hypothetical protein